MGNNTIPQHKMYTYYSDLSISQNLRFTNHTQKLGYVGQNWSYI